jgi:hypothetical protein
MAIKSSRDRNNEDADKKYFLIKKEQASIFVICF